MSTGYQIKDQSQAYFLTFRVVYWIDVFTRKECRDIVIESIRYCQEHKGLELFAFVVMSNHVHILARSNINDLSGTIRDFKKFTSKRIVDFIEQDNESRKAWILRLFAHAAKRQNKSGEYQVWAHGNHAELAYSSEFISSKVSYIHNNPVRAMLVKNAEDYLYSSARCYADQEGILDMVRVVAEWKTYV